MAAGGSILELDVLSFPAEAQSFLAQRDLEMEFILPYDQEVAKARAQLKFQCQEDVEEIQEFQEVTGTQFNSMRF